MRVFAASLLAAIQHSVTLESCFSPHGRVCVIDLGSALLRLKGLDAQFVQNLVCIMNEEMTVVHPIV